MLRHEFQLGIDIAGCQRLFDGLGGDARQMGDFRQLMGRRPKDGLGGTKAPKQSRRQARPDPRHQVQGQPIAFFAGKIHIGFQGS
jgi:hypothetical protein